MMTMMQRAAARSRRRGGSRVAVLWAVGWLVAVVLAFAWPGSAQDPFASASGGLAGSQGATVGAGSEPASALAPVKVTPAGGSGVASPPGVPENGGSGGLIPVGNGVAAGASQVSGAHAGTGRAATEPPPRARLSVVAGDGQVVLAGERSTPLTLRVEMPDESPVIGAEIDLLVGNKPEKAKLTGLATASRPLVTDSHGVASFTLTVDTPGEVRLLAQLRNDPGQVVPVTVKVLDPSWNMHLMFGLAGGLGMFLFGMNLGADGLQKIAGRRMKSILGAVTGNTYLGILTGIVVTAIVQSSSATTVMLVGFVNASLMTLGQTLSVIMGANVGTTITVQLIAFDISHWALLLIGVGFFMTMARDRNTGYLGTIALGFGLIFYGMKVMSTAMGPLRAYPAFREVLISFKLYPITAIVGSMLFTSIIQSSGATIGLLVAFASQGLIDLQAAVPLILGAHIGTCITGWIAALGASLEARQTAMLNVVYNLVGTVVFLPFLYDPLSFADMVEWVSQPFGATGARMVANAHMISAILKVIVLLPLADYILRLTLWLMPNEEKAGEKVMRVKFLSDSLLATPELALGNVAREISRMAGHVEFMVQSVPALISRGEETLIAEVFAHEQKVDFLRGQITQYLSRLAETNLNSEQSELMVCYMNVINELEGLGDQVQKVIVPLSRTKRDKQCRLSEEGYRELMRMFHEVNGVFLQSINAFATNNQAMYDKVMASESRVQKLEEELRASHMRRVFERRDQSVQTSAMHLDLLGCLKGIHEQAVRIARSLQHHPQADAPGVVQSIPASVPLSVIFPPPASGSGSPQVAAGAADNGVGPQQPAAAVPTPPGSPPQTPGARPPDPPPPNDTPAFPHAG